VSAQARWLALAAAALLSGPVRAAGSEADVRAQVHALLGSFRSVTVAQWRALGPDAAPVLEAVARDGAALPTRRARALAALGVIRPLSAEPLIRQLASDSTAPSVLRTAAVDAAPGVLGPGAVALLTPLLRDGDAMVRVRSAEALATSGTAGCQAVVAETRAHAASAELAATAARCAEQLRARGAPER
jgi:hypothetical protein